jgi:hypothetical protein
MERSKNDELFFETFRYYPTKAGQAYEMLVAAAWKLLFNQDIAYNQFVKGEYSGTTYQLDGLTEADGMKTMIEAKDYTLDERKVGRPDLQKLQGALTDLSVDKGVVASATEFSGASKKYADASYENPMQKGIDLFHVRPSTEEDERGRLLRIVLRIQMHVPDFKTGKYKFCFTKEGEDELRKDGLMGSAKNYTIENFYDKEGAIKQTFGGLTRNSCPQTTWEENYIARACWILEDCYFKLDDKLYGINGLEYEIPFRISGSEVVIEGGGKPKIFFRAEDGSIDKLITDEQLRKIRFHDGRVELQD